MLKSTYSIISLVVIALAVACDNAWSQGAAIQEAPPSVAGARIILLGTGGGPLPRKYRAQPASLLVVDGSAYLIDAGDGVIRQLTWADTSVTHLKSVFLTHHHLDHTAGLGSVIAYRWIAIMSGAVLPPLQIFGPPGTQEISDAAMKYFSVSERIFRSEAPTAPALASIIAAHDAMPGLIYEDAKIRVTAVENSHYSTVIMPDTPHGVDKSYSLRFDTKYGAIVFTGDTGPSEALVNLAKDADILVSEVIDVADLSNFLRGRKNLPEASAQMMIAHMEHEHLPPEDLGKLAAKAHVKMVVLTHLSTSGEVKPDMTPFTAGIQQHYSGPVIAGQDLSEFDLTQVRK